MKTIEHLYFKKLSGMDKIKHMAYLFLILIVFGGCKSYTSNIILQTEPKDVNWKEDYQRTIINYPVKVADKIQFALYTNMGEAIIDPSGKLVVASAIGEENSISADRPSYEVSETGYCHFPVIGKLNVVGLTLPQLDSLLSSKYETYYNGVYVMSKIANKRVIILGGGNAGGKVIPFTNPNMNLLEALAIYGGLENTSKGYNIRIIRGDLKNPEYTTVNLRTIADMKSSIINLKPDDIIYIEPVRRPFAESARDNLFIINIVQVLVTFSILVNTLVK